MRKIGIFSVFFLCFFAAEMLNSAKIQEDLRENLLRLHITANSDSDYDQKIKLCVRDGLIRRFGEEWYNELEICANEMKKIGMI